MATGGVDDPSYEETANFLKDDDDTNETGRSNPTYASTPAPPSGEEIEMAVKHLERGGAFGPETSYAETRFGGSVTTEDIERRLDALRNPTTGLLDASFFLLKTHLSEEDSKRNRKI